MPKGRENIEKRKGDPLDPHENAPEYKEAFDGAIEMIEAEYGPEGTEAACKGRVARVEEFFEREIDEMRLLADNVAEEETFYLEPSELRPYYAAERMDLETGLDGLRGHRLGSAKHWARSASLGERLSESRNDSMVKRAGSAL